MTVEKDHSFAPFHDHMRAGWFCNDTDELFTGVPITREDVVLDVGCGDGMNAAFCARRGAEIILADRDADKIALAEKNLIDTPARAVRAIVTDCDPIPVSDETASVVVSTEVLEHVDDADRFLRELVRVGRHGAHYLLTVPDPVAETLQKSLAPPQYFEKPNHLRIIGREEFGAMVERAGLVIERRSSYGFYWSLWWLMFWTCNVDFPGARHPVLDSWTKTWGELLDTKDGQKVKDVLDRFLPKSQLIIARKP